jgi:hypothetical protein
LRHSRWRQRQAGRRFRRNRGRRTRQQLAELRRQGFGRVGEGLALLNLGHQRAQDVDRGQQDVGEGLDLGQGSAAEGSEEILHRVRQLGHAPVPDGRGRALEGVSGPENLVDDAGVETVLELEQALFDALDLLERLVREETVVAGLQIEGQRISRPLASATWSLTSP